MSRTALTILASVLVLGGGFALGRLAFPAACEDRTKPAEIKAVKKQLQELKSRVVTLETLAFSYREYLKGTPLPWPERIPDQYRPEQFQKIVARGLEEIQAPVEIAGFECLESPCIAKLRLHQGYISKVQLSRAWQENFGKGVTGSPVSVDCGNGRTENIELIAAEWNGQHDPRSMSAEEYKKAMQQEAHRLIKGRLTKEEAERGKRLSLRLRRARILWECAP